MVGGWLDGRQIAARVPSNQSFRPACLFRPGVPPHGPPPSAPGSADTAPGAITRSTILYPIVGSAAAGRSGRSDRSGEQVKPRCWNATVTPDGLLLRRHRDGE